MTEIRADEEAKLSKEFKN